jgi:hypothetical protein
MLRIWYCVHKSQHSHHLLMRHGQLIWSGDKCKFKMVKDLPHEITVATNIGKF